MYKLVVAIFALVNGAHGPDPKARVYVTGTFDSERTCKNFLGSEEGAKAKATLDSLVARLGEVEVVIECPKVDDGSI